MIHCWISADFYKCSPSSAVPLLSFHHQTNLSSKSQYSNVTSSTRTKQHIHRTIALITMNAFTGENNANAQGTSNPMTGNTTAGAGAEHNDYGDKAFDALAKKTGHNINPSTSEKITDGARGLFEKATGLVHSLSALWWRGHQLTRVHQQQEGRPQVLQLDTKMEMALGMCMTRLMDGHWRLLSEDWTGITLYL